MPRALSVHTERNNLEAVAVDDNNKIIIIKTVSLYPAANHHLFKGILLLSQCILSDRLVSLRLEFLSL